MIWPFRLILGLLNLLFHPRTVALAVGITLSYYIIGFHDLVHTGRDLRLTAMPHFHHLVEILLFIAVGLMVIFPKRWAGFLGLLIVAFYMTEMSYYQDFLIKRAPTFKNPPTKIFEVSSYGLRTSRKKEAPHDDDRARVALKQLKNLKNNHGEVYASAYGFLQFDPCYSEFRTHTLPEKVDRLMRARRQSPPRRVSIQDKWLLRALGCYSSKLKLSTYVKYAENLKEAEAMVRQRPRTDKKTVILREVPVEEQIPASELTANPARGIIRTKFFSANRLTVEVELLEPEEAWLVYADSYHPGWQATVNDEPVPIVEANLAFKAVKVKKGKSRVEFVFKGQNEGWPNYGMAILGLGFGLITLLAMIKTMFPMKFIRPKPQRTLVFGDPYKAYSSNDSV